MKFDESETIELKEIYTPGIREEKSWVYRDINVELMNHEIG